MGVELCAETSADEIVSTISEETGKFFFPQIEEVDTGTVVRLITLTMDIYYGGTSWSYIDVYLNEDSKVICVRLNASFESIDRAKDHFTVWNRHTVKGMKSMKISLSGQMTRTR